MTKQETKTLVIARYGTLESGTNYKGTMKQSCDMCKTKDDENHRLYDCPKWSMNRGNDRSIEKINFNEIYSASLDTIRPILSKVDRMWNTRNAHGTMRTE